MTSTTTRPGIVVLGAGYAGLMTVDTLLKADVDAEITVVDASEEFSERIRLHQVAVGDHAPPARFEDRFGDSPADFVHGLATALDPAAKTLTLSRPGGVTETLNYDWLVLAIGSATGPGDVAGVCDHAWMLDNASGAAVLHDVVMDSAAVGGRLAIVGGGLTGIEAAAEFAERLPSLRVTLISGQPLGADLAGGAAAHVVQTLDALGVKIIENTVVSGVGEAEIELSGAPPVPYDLCLWTCGFFLPPLAREAGLAVNDRGQVNVDPCLRSVSHPDILAAGDIAAGLCAAGRGLRLSCATAMPAGRHVGAALAALLRGEEPAPFRFSYFMRCISLGRRDGLIQFVDGQDRPLDNFWTGTRAAETKEFVCAGALAAVGMGPPPGPPPHEFPERPA